MKQETKQQGFTLIELLVVIAIIAILAALLFPAITGVLKKGKTTTAQTEVKSIESALNAYYTDYGKFPKDNGVNNDAVYGMGNDNKDIINALRGLDATLNPRKINYLEVATKSLDAGGNMVDPWSAQYKIAVNTDFDQTVEKGVTNLSGRNVAVWSDGLPGENTPIKSW